MSFDETLPDAGNYYWDEGQSRDSFDQGGSAQRPPTQNLGWDPQQQGYSSQRHGAGHTEVMYRAPQVMAWLIIVSDGPHYGKPFSLSPDVTGIGRDVQNDILLDDPAVSRQHAKIRYEAVSSEEKQFFIYDLATANGTKVNGEEILKQPLYDEDRIEIGRVTMVFKQIDGPERPAAKSEPEAAETP